MLLKLVCVAGGRRGRVKTKKVSAGNSGCPPPKKRSFTTNTVLQKNSAHFQKLQGWGGCRLENTRTILQPSQQGNVAPHSFFSNREQFPRKKSRIRERSSWHNFSLWTQNTKKKKRRNAISCLLYCFFYHFIRKQATCFAFAFCRFVVVLLLLRCVVGFAFVLLCFVVAGFLLCFCFALVCFCFACALLVLLLSINCSLQSSWLAPSGNCHMLSAKSFRKCKSANLNPRCLDPKLQPNVDRCRFSICNMCVSEPSGCFPKGVRLSRQKMVLWNFQIWFVWKSLDAWQISWSGDTELRIRNIQIAECDAKRKLEVTRVTEQVLECAAQCNTIRFKWKRKTKNANIHHRRQENKAG